MITNAMFYRTKDEKDEMQKGGITRLGPFEIDHQQVYVGTISILTIMPVNFLLVALFKSVQMSYEGHEALAVITGDSIKNNLKRSCRAPPIMKYVAWTLVFLSIVLSAFFVIMYSLTWGPEKSQSWLTSMVTSFLESLLILEPIKVCIVFYPMVSTIVLANATDTRKISHKVVSFSSWSQLKHFWVETWVLLLLMNNCVKIDEYKQNVSL